MDQIISPLFPVGSDYAFGSLDRPTSRNLAAHRRRARNVDRARGPTSTFSPYLYLFNVPAWSLCFEFIANAAYAFVLVRWRSNTLLGFTAAAAGLLALAVSRQWFALGSHEAGVLDSGFQWTGFWAGILRVAFSFCAGVLIFRVRSTYALALTINPAVLVAGLFGLLAIPVAPAWQGAYALSTVFAVFPMIVFLGSYSTATGKVLNVFAQGGAISYAVYVLQEPIYHVAAGLIFDVSLTDPQRVGCGLLFMCSVAICAAAADIFFDTPVRKWLHSVTKRVGSL